MVDIRQIDDCEFSELIELYYDYNQCLTSKHNKYTSTSLLVNTLREPGALALGLYHNKILVGFTLGYSISIDNYYFTAMYIVPKFRYYTKKLFESSEDFIRPDYKGWVSTSSTPEGINMHKKMGIKPVEIKYYKEL